MAAFIGIGGVGIGVGIGGGRRRLALLVHSAELAERLHDERRTDLVVGARDEAGEEGEAHVDGARDVALWDVAGRDQVSNQHERLGQEATTVLERPC